MKTIRSVFHRMLGMCPAAWTLFLGSLQLSCAMLLFSLLIHAGILAPTGALQLADALYEIPEAILLIGLLGSVCVEDLYTKRS